MCLQTATSLRLSTDQEWAIAMVFERPNMETAGKKSPQSDSGIVLEVVVEVFRHEPGPEFNFREDSELKSFNKEMNKQKEEIHFDEVKLWRDNCSENRGPDWSTPLLTTNYQRLGPTAFNFFYSEIIYLTWHQIILMRVIWAVLSTTIIQQIVAAAT